MAIDFEKPPINEVVIGKVYETRTDLTIPYFGRFWDLVKDEFPTCEHAIPIVDQPAANMLAALGSLLPRVWFIGQDATRLIQLQQDRFYYDWRQTPGQSENYVRFDSIYKQYRKYSDVLSAFIVSQLGSELVSKRLDLTYVNALPQGDVWNELSDLSSVFRGLDFISSYGRIGAVSQGALRIELKMTNCPGTMTVQIGSGKSAPNEKSIVRMELSCTCELSQFPGVSESEWYKAAHDAIVGGFCEVTTERAQRLWKRLS